MYVASNLSKFLLYFEKIKRIFLNFTSYSWNIHSSIDLYWNTWLFMKSWFLLSLPLWSFIYIKIMTNARQNSLKWDKTFTSI